MKTYVLGFAFSQNKQNVLLIKKNRPAWQAGKLNGVGGKIEEGETPAQAMVREFEEETGIKSTEADWQPYAHLGSRKDDANPWSMHVFCTFTLPLHTAQSQTDEEVMQVPVQLEKLGLIEANSEGTPKITWNEAIRITKGMISKAKKRQKHPEVQEYAEAIGIAGA